MCVLYIYIYKYYTYYTGFAHHLNMYVQQYTNDTTLGSTEVELLCWILSMVLLEVGPQKRQGVSFPQKTYTKLQTKLDPNWFP